MNLKAKILPELSDDLIKRFWSHVNVKGENECWEWTGSICYGYGHFSIGRGIYKAHRIAYYLSTSFNDPMLMVCHTCDNRKCCNPKHHFTGTNSDNIIDMFRKGRFPIKAGIHHHSKTKPETVAKGEKCQAAKLTAEKVLEMREVHKCGGVTYAEIGKRYGVDISVARRAILKHNWKHI